MKYFSLNCVKNAYELVSANTKDKFWGILGILYSIDSLAKPGVNFSINTEKLSNFLEQTFRLKDKKTYNAPSSEYSVVFANDWEEKTTDNFIVNTPDIMPIIIWAYRSFAFDRELNSHELFEKFIRDFHLSKDSAEKFFNIKFDGIVIEYSDNEYDDVDLFNKLGGNQTPDAATIKMNKSFVVANAGDLSRGPFFQPLYASLNTLECLIIFPFDAKKYYQVFTSVEKCPVSDIWAKTRQIIYYGAPGTGKSHKIKEKLEGVSKENIFRTTFHPDSDYSTFVGAYKPSRGKKPLYGLNGGLTVRLNNGEDLSEEIITYKFIPQAFLNAYMRAYSTTDNVYLVIEEINRGNCAQIFGDLFQLLDRDEKGVSEYTIKADTDLKEFLIEELGADSDAIKDGELCLPSNLYIYATMNTSDQSLFPIDSAFKRRWDWEYEPIKKKNTNWIIDINGNKYSWVSFQEEINERILRATSSEDKMLGDYFVNPVDGVITEKILLNKILFYLWNDVCKDGEGDIFKTAENEEITFSDLHGDGGTDKLIAMMTYLKVKEA